MTATYTTPARPDTTLTDTEQPPFDWRPVVWFVAVLVALIAFFH